MLLADLLDSTGITPPEPRWRGLRVCDITEDSRTVVPGSLFIARRGSRFDGGAFVDDALRRGAVAVLSDAPAPRNWPGRAVWIHAPDILPSAALVFERFFGEPARRLALAGVTGTNGKTTVCHAIQQLLNVQRRCCGLIGTVDVDDGREVAPATLTTPGPGEISYALRNMVDAGDTCASLEVSSHALDQGRVAALRFDVCVFTNLSGEHLDYHGTMDAYAEAKARLFALATPGATAVVSDADPWTDRMLARFAGREVLRCAVGDGASADCQVMILGAQDNGASRCVFAGPWGEFPASVRLPGAHNALNLLQASAAAHVMGADAQELRAGIERFAPPPGRFQRVAVPNADAGDLPRVYVDYAHTDDALDRTLSVARGLAQRAGGRLVVVFGCGGDRDREKRPRSGAVVARFADLAVVTVNDAHTEPPASIIEGILGGVPPERRQSFVVHADRGRAIREGVALAEPRDVVVIAGKGHERVQYLPDGAGGEHAVPFNDLEEAQRALVARRSESAEANPV